MRILAIGTLFSCASVAAAQAPAAPVVVAPVIERDVAEGRTFVGTVEPVRRSTVGSETDGVVVEYVVNEGDRVKKGQTLAKQRPRLTEIALLSARAELELRQQELKELENGSRPEEIARARALVSQVATELDFWKWKFQRSEELYKTNTISEDEVRDARLAAKRAEEKYTAEVASLELIEAGPRKERIAQARARVQVREADVARLEDLLERHTIRAPFDGYVVAEHTEVGQWLDKGDPVAEIVALDFVDVTISVLEDYVNHLTVGMPVVVSVGAVREEKLLGKLALIVPAADVRTRTFPVKVRIKNRRLGGALLLKAGMFARATLAVGKKTRALLVDKDAIVLGGPKPVVFVVDEETKKVHRVPVELGIAQDGLIQVSGDLEAGSRVVVRGNERLLPGHKVRVLND